MSSGHRKFGCHETVKVVLVVVDQRASYLKLSEAVPQFRRRQAAQRHGAAFQIAATPSFKRRRVTGCAIEGNTRGVSLEGSNSEVYIMNSDGSEQRKRPSRMIASPTIGAITDSLRQPHPSVPEDLGVTSCEANPVGEWGTFSLAEEQWEHSVFWKPSWP
jgi:hypothetical protein